MHKKEALELYSAPFLFMQIAVKKYFAGLI